MHLLAVLPVWRDLLLYCCPVVGKAEVQTRPSVLLLSVECPNMAPQMNQAVRQIYYITSQEIPQLV